MKVGGELRAIDELRAADDQAGLATERGEQHGHAVAVTHFLQDNGLKAAERAVANFDEVAGVNPRAHGYDIDRLARPLLELVDDRVIDDGGTSAEADHADDLGSVLDGAEAPRRIEAAEEIAREERADNPTFHAADGFVAF